jgi:methionine-rich copper-binding protein CopC
MRKWGWLGLTAVLLVAGAVQAHARLLRASPAAGAELSAAPAEIRLFFNEPLRAGNEITLYGRDFSPTIALAAAIDPADSRQLFAPAPPLAPGDYTVQWTAVSQDGHPITGSYTFTLLPPDAGRPSPVVWLILALGLGLPLLLLGSKRALLFRASHRD